MTENAKTPSIRFKGFTDAWEQRKLGEFSEKVTEKNVNNEFSETFTNSAEYGIVSQREFFDHDIAKTENLNGYYIVRENDFVYNPRISVTAPVGPINRNKKGKIGVMSPLYTVFRVNNVDYGFLEQYFKSMHWHSFMRFNGDSGARSDRFSIKSDLFFAMRIKLPKNEEQIGVGRMLELTDNLITLHQRKCDKLVNVKKSLLEKMFPSGDERVPQIRFKGFTEAWEQRKFSELATTRRGLTYNPTNIAENGVRVLRSSNIKEDVFTLSEDDVFVCRNAVNIEYVHEHEILITAANGSTRLVGKHAIIIGISEKSAVHGGFMLIAAAKSPFFLNASMSAPWYTKFINLFVAGGNGAIGNLSKNDLDEQNVYVPLEVEQVRIGELFKQLDNLITLHQRKLEKLKNIKKSLLEKMFV